MNIDAVVAASAVERRAVADLLDGLDDRQLATPSLGRGIDLLMAACGRARLLDELSGSGAAVLAARVRSR